MCEHAVLNKRGMTQWLTCDKDGDFCPFQRVCHDTKSIINTTTYVNCPKLILISNTNSVNLTPAMLNETKNVTVKNKKRKSKKK